MNPDDIEDTTISSFAQNYQSVLQQNVIMQKYKSNSIFGSTIATGGTLATTGNIGTSGIGQPLITIKLSDRVVRESIPDLIKVYQEADELTRLCAEVPGIDSLYRQLQTAVKLYRNEDES